MSDDKDPKAEAAEKRAAALEDGQARSADTDDRGFIQRGDN